MLGDKVTNQKCLDCHKEIKSRVDRNEGYHASSMVRGKDCFSCHSEHHGRAFDIVRFDTKQFDHRTTGYPLTGAHLQVDCRQCHTSQNIKDNELKNRPNTYLGLDDQCVSCHRDVHRNTLSTNCASCHVTDAFVPASKFDHAKTDFPLRGKHQQVDCRQCHEVTGEGVGRYQKFTGIAFNSCVSCHQDPHNNQLGNDCKACHNEESFASINSNPRFDHNQTGFPLKGKHNTIDCKSCHQINASTTPTNAFQDFARRDVQQCIACHDDVHEGRFGTDCKQCHDESSFRRLANPDAFDHDLTDWPLEGKHEIVDCKQCHAKKLTDPVAHAACMDCHDDFHEGQFVRMGKTIDCRECHTVEGFAGSTYSFAEHNQSDFPLTGAHLATPCFACHLQEEKWVFKDLGMQCVNCHTDIHDGSIAEKYYPQQACDKCHVPDAWSTVSFEHSLTGFGLVGVHQSTACISCHEPEGERNERRILFTGLVQECAACHDNVHGTQFEEAGATDCRRCHTPEHWAPSTIDHQATRFPLEGAHANVSCAACHKPEPIDGEIRTRYKFESIECATCHL